MMINSISIFTPEQRELLRNNTMYIFYGFDIITDEPEVYRIDNYFLHISQIDQFLDEIEQKGEAQWQISNDCF
jgi:hypothetical protein